MLKINKKKFYNSGVVLGQNCIRLSDAVLNDFKNLFYQRQFKYAMNIGVAQI